MTIVCITEIFCLSVWFSNHIVCSLVTGYSKDITQVTTMAYETWACIFRPYLPVLTLQHLRDLKQ